MHNARLLHDLEPGQEVLVLSPIDHKSYIEGTVVSQAQEPRSYILESQGCRYRWNRQHICPITTHIESPFTRPCTDTTLQNTHNSQPFQDHHLQSQHNKCTQFQSLQDHYHKYRQIHSEWENTVTNPPKPCLTPKSHNTTSCQCPYSRPQHNKPSNLQPNPISGTSSHSRNLLEQFACTPYIFKW